MRHSSRLIGSDDYSDTSTDVPDVFSHDATDDSLDSASEDSETEADASTIRIIILAMTQSWMMNGNFLRNTTSKRLDASMPRGSGRNVTVHGPRTSWTRHGDTGIGEKLLLLNLNAGANR